VTILADGWAIDTYITRWPVVYALVLNPTQADGVARLTESVRVLRFTAARFDRAQNGDRVALYKLWPNKATCVAGLVMDGWYGAAARGLRERLARDMETLAKLRAGREEYYAPYVCSYHRRRDLAVRAWRVLKGQKLLDILEVTIEQCRC